MKYVSKAKQSNHNVFQIVVKGVETFFVPLFFSKISVMIRNKDHKIELFMTKEGNNKVMQEINFAFLMGFFLFFALYTSPYKQQSKTL
jgi:hypothetical protein